MANDGVIIAHLSVEFGGNLGFRFKVHEDVVTIFVPIDLKSKLALFPLASRLHRAAVGLHDALELVGDCLHLGVAVATGNDVHSFVFARIHGLFGLNGRPKTGGRG